VTFQVFLLHYFDCYYSFDFSNSYCGLNKLIFEEVNMGLLSDFKEFLYEYKVIPLAIALIMGIAATAFVKSFVDNIVMPIITPFIPGGAWETATLQIGPIIVLRWGAFLGETINFIIIAFVVFLVAKMVLKEEKVAKK
jgi:large conductance mechanosensitive channel